MTYRRTTTFTLHVVEEYRDDDADETPSLPAQRVYDTDGEDITHTRGPALAKCGPVASAGAERRRKAAK
jgi:hypothetical protein